MSHRLDDNTIAHFVKLIQMAILSGTDITDNFRLVELIIKDNKVCIDENYLLQFNENIDKLVAQIEQEDVSNQEKGVFDG